MNKYLIRFNKTRGQPGRGTAEHVWRVFENGTKEYLAKHVDIRVPSRDEVSIDPQGNQDWNICCFGVLSIDKTTATAIISAETI